MKPREARVVLAFTSRGDDFAAGVMEYVLEQFRRFKSIAVTTAISTWMPSLEPMFAALERTGDFDYVHVIDSDVVLQPDTTERLISHGKDLIVSPVWMYDPAMHDAHLNIIRDYKRTRIRDLGVGVEECWGGTFSSALIAKRVLHSFVMAQEKFTEVSPLVDDFPFNCLDGVFFAKAVKMGYQPYVDWDAGPATHVKKIFLNNRFMLNVIQANERRPIFANRDQAGPPSRLDPEIGDPTDTGGGPGDRTPEAPVA